MAQPDEQRRTWPIVARVVTGLLAGGVLGGLVGFFGPMCALLAVFGRTVDQGMLLIFLTGPLGAVLGAVTGAIGGAGWRRAWAVGAGAIVALAPAAVVALKVHDDTLGLPLSILIPLLGGVLGWVLHAVFCHSLPERLLGRKP